jgi:hypothetical protein
MRRGPGLQNFKPLLDLSGPSAQNVLHPSDSLGDSRGIMLFRPAQISGSDKFPYEFVGCRLGRDFNRVTHRSSLTPQR